MPPADKHLHRLLYPCMLPFLYILTCCATAAGDLSGRADIAGLGAHATSQLTQQVCAATAPGIMALARQHNNQQLQVRHPVNDYHHVTDVNHFFILVSSKPDERLR
jgi:hypothetical protein